MKCINLGTVDLDRVVSTYFRETIIAMLRNFPDCKLNPRLVVVDYKAPPLPPKYYSVTFKMQNFEPVDAIYHGNNMYLFAVVVGNVVYQLDAKFEVPKSLFPGKNIELIHLGTSYLQLFDPKDLCFTKAWIRQAFMSISKGYDRSRSTSWRKAVVHLIFCTSESLRCPEVRDFVALGFDDEDFNRRCPSRRVMKLVHSWGKMSQAVWDRDYPFCLVYKDDSLYENDDDSDGNLEDGHNTDQSIGDEVDSGSGLIEGVGGVDMVADGGVANKVIGDGGDIADGKIICSGADVVEGGGEAMGLVIENGWATQKFGEAGIEKVISLVSADTRDRKDELKPEPKPVKREKSKAISRQSGKRGPQLRRGMCISSVFWSSRFGRRMGKSVFSSPTFGRGMCTSVSPSPAVVRGPELRRGMCISVFWRSRFGGGLGTSVFGRGMCTSVFSSPAFGRGMCTSVFTSPAVVRGPMRHRGTCTYSVFWSSRFGGMCTSSVFPSPAVVKGSWHHASVRGCPVLQRSSPNGIYSASRQMFRLIRSVFRR